MTLNDVTQLFVVCIGQGLGTVERYHDWVLGVLLRPEPAPLLQLVLQGVQNIVLGISRGTHRRFATRNLLRVFSLCFSTGP